jgi:DNA-binding transcriptional regulator PaaX
MGRKTSDKTILEEVLLSFIPHTRENFLLLYHGKWRILFFDIPEKERAKRNSLRKKLKKLGFRQYQLSAWICPFDYTEELDIFINELGLDHYVQYIIGESIKGQEKFKGLFGLKAN